MTRKPRATARAEPQQIRNAAELERVLAIEEHSADAFDKAFGTHTANPQSAPSPVRPESWPSPEVRLIPLAELHDSLRNPRREYDQSALQELAASLKEQGQTTPLLVRPRKSGGYEVAAGSRRKRAAALAGLPALRAEVRDLDDRAFTAIALAEQLQHVGLSALEEADGYKRLQLEHGYTVERIAAEIGKSGRYVYDSLSLHKLTAPARKLLQAGTITRAHAVELARLTPKDQARAIGDPDEQAGDPDAPLFEDERAQGDLLPESDEMPVKVRSVRELKAWINRHVRFDRFTADPMLFPETAELVSAATVGKEKVIAITYEYQTPAETRADEKTWTVKSWQRADGREGSKVCPHSVVGVVVAGPARGEAFRVCVKKEHCDVHWAKERAQRARQEKARAAYREKHGESAKSEPAWQREQRLRSEREARERAKWVPARAKILAALAAKVKAAPTGASSTLGDLVIDGVKDAWGYGKGRELVPRGRTADDLVRHAAWIVIVQQCGDHHFSNVAAKLCKQWGVDPKPWIEDATPPAAPPAKKATKAARAKKR